MKKIKKVVALLSIVSLLIATAFSASAVSDNRTYNRYSDRSGVGVYKFEGFTGTQL